MCVVFSYSTLSGCKSVVIKSVVSYQLSDVVFIWKILKASAKVTLLFQRNKFLDVTDDNEERPLDQSYVSCDVTNIISHELSVLAFSLLLTATTTTTVLRPFVWDYPGEPIPEETFTQSHPVSYTHLTLPTNREV